MLESLEEISFECDDKVFMKLNIYLIIEGALIELDKRNIELVTYKTKRKECLIAIIFNKATNVAILGSRFVRRFGVVLDEDDKTIWFDADIPSFKIDNVRKKISNYNLLLLICLCDSCFLFSLGLGIEVYCKTVLVIEK